jgi:oxaloacetate decarboxylase gamma subunit
MENIIFQALQLLAVGMITVFLILSIVIGLGKALISVVNRIAPEENGVKKTPDNSKANIDNTTISIINAAVNQITGGKGKVQKIEKI